MPNPVTVLPDDELALIQFLRTVPEVTALAPAEQIAAEAGPEPTYPLVTVQRIGGSGATEPGRWIDSALVQVDVTGPDNRHDCKVLAQTVRAAVLAIANDTVGEGVLASASEVSPPQWLPDSLSTPPLPRFTARYRIVLHP